MSSTKKIRIFRTRVLAAEIALACMAMVSFAAGAQTAMANENNGSQAVTTSQAQATVTKSADEQKKQQPTQLQTVVVTGTRAISRTAIDSLAPIDVLTSTDLVNTGQPSLGLALRSLLPSFNMPQAAVRGSATQNIRPASLRGLPPDNTLVLINGKRVHTTAYTNTSGFSSGSSPVDFASIPVDAIERIEVLRDGASALYGSDAIAGVINVILKGGYQRGSAHVTNGQWDGGQGNTWQAGASGGVALGQKGWVHLSANYMRQNATNHAGPDNRYPSDPTYGQVTMRFGLPHVISKQAALNAQYALGEHATLYGFSVFSKRQAEQASTFQSLSQYKNSFPDVVALVPDGYLTQHHNGMLDSNSTLGARGDFLGWDYDVSITNGSSHWKQALSNTVNKSLGALSPRSFYAGTNIATQNSANADFRRGFDVGLPDLLNVAWGLAHTNQKYTQKAGEPSAFIGVGEGTKPKDAGSISRHNEAAYIDVSADFTKKFTAEFNARYEHYSDFGNATVWGVKGRYQFASAFAMRGTISTGFRAPSVQMEGYSSTGVTFVHLQSGVLAPFEVRTFRVTDPAAIALGARPLEPEKSRTYSLGAVFTPDFGLNVTLDAYQVEVDNTIQWTANLVGDQVRTFLESFGIQGVNGGRFATNLTNNRVRGIDLVGSWPVDLGNSRLLLSFGYNYNTSKITSVKPYPAVWDTIGLNPVIGRAARLSAKSNKSFVAATWRTGPWSVNARVTGYSSFWFRTNSPVFDERYAPRYLTDLSVVRGVGAWNFTLGAQNIFNIYPERARMGIWSLNDNITYPNDAPMGYNGRYVYADISYRW